MAIKPRNPLRVVGYIRVSTDDQQLGPEAQRLALDAWCVRHGAELVACFSDIGVSGAAPIEKRPGLLDALDALADLDAGILLAAKRDRLARDAMLAAMIERLVERGGGAVRTADDAGVGDGPEAALFRGILDCFAQYERGVIRARTRAALAVKRGRGEKTGHCAAYGLRLAADGAHLEADEREAGAVQAALSLRASGLSLRAIGSRLAAEGLHPRAGGAWQAKTISRMIERAA